MALLEPHKMELIFDPEVLNNTDLPCVKKTVHVRKILKAAKPPIPVRITTSKLHSGGESYREIELHFKRADKDHPFINQVGEALCATQRCSRSDEEMAQLALTDCGHTAYTSYGFLFSIDYEE